MTPKISHLAWPSVGPKQAVETANQLIDAVAELRLELVRLEHRIVELEARRES